MTKPAAKVTDKLLKLKKRSKQKQPNFVRPESWRYVRIKENWRKPRGLDHKVRLKYAGWPPASRAGYRSPRTIRGLHPSGCREVLIYNVEGLKDVEPKTQVVRIAHVVGKRKRVRILAEAKKKKIRVLNARTAKEVTVEEAKIREKEEDKEKQEAKGSEAVEKEEAEHQ